MSSNFDTCYVSCGCNKCPHAADWGKNGLICYAVCNSIAIYDPSFAKDSGKVLHTLHGHSERVNSVRWFRNESDSPENVFISASADGSAIIWSWSDKVNCYVEEALLKGHSSIVSVADGLIRRTAANKYIPEETPLMVATASIDSTVGIWRRNKKGDVKLIDVIDWGSGFCLDVRMVLLPQSNLVMLACAAHDNAIHLFVEKIGSELDDETGRHVFEKVHVLTGHDDWIRALDIITDVENNIFIASASQDSFVRIYKISQQPHHLKVKKIQNAEVENDLEIETKVITVGVNQTSYNYGISLESVLSGHEGWVYGVSWYNPCSKPLVEVAENADASGDLARGRKMKLLSSSMDKTMIIWCQDKAGAWVEDVRLGEVGGNTLGFYGGKFRSDGLAVLGHGFQGSFHMWGFSEEKRNWEPMTVVGGHTAEVMDLSWDLKGNYILTVGSDQTTRLHAPWCRNDEKMITWHELARPQIHGYDLTAVAVLSEQKFATGAEEKVIRGFTAPNNFIENFRRLSKSNYDEGNAKGECLPQGALVPALGLSNKPVFDQMKKEGFIVNDEYPDLYFSPISLTKPPTEENLLQNTLWPEAQKLYGHGFEIYSLAARGDGTILASSCQATSPEHAGIILWNAKTWLPIQKLMSHQLTVTQMAFSPDGKYLLAVSRDRKWSLFVVQSNGKNYDLLSTNNTKNGLHTRVIWTCAWACDSVTFATGSRDGKIGFWSVTLPYDPDVSKNVRLLTSIELPKESVTALAFAPVLRRNFHILAVGLETGVIQLYRYASGTAESLWVLFNGPLGHQKAVKRLAFRPVVGRAGEGSDDTHYREIIQMASCSSDHMLKVYDIFLELL